MYGAESDPEGNGHAIEAACTAYSAISGLGIEAATTTLASTQITYVDVTVTDGQAKLQETPTPVNGVGEGGEETSGSGEEGVDNAAAERSGGASAMCLGVIVGAMWCMML